MNESIRILRNQHNYSQSSVAEYLGISRQMYIKYEVGTAELPVKTIKALSSLYKVTTDVILEDKLAENQKRNVEYPYEDDTVLDVASPDAGYAAPDVNTVMNLLSKLVLSDQINVMAKLAAMIQKKTAPVETPLAQKNKKIPDEEYVRQMNQENFTPYASYAAIREALKNDVW